MPSGRVEGHPEVSGGRSMTAPSTQAAAFDIRTADDPPGVGNPFWNQVRQIPADTILGSVFADGQWQPDGFNLELYRKGGRGFPSRDVLVHRYSWAIPDPLSVQFVAAYTVGFDGLVEIGAGTGYWAWQLAQRGVDVAAFDEAPPDRVENDYCQDKHLPADQRLRTTYHPVAEGNTRRAKDFPNRALFLCWPPYGSSMAAAALDFYTGNRLIYLGEGEGGCCADDDFFTALGKDWTEVAEHRPVQWGGIHGWITVYDRKAST